jgi:hypothetical protein
MSAVVESHEIQSARMGKVERTLCLLFGGGLLVVLITARMLQPSEYGYGTHQQLGLPPCTFTSMFGIRCPSCGMTTSWSNLTRGRVITALESNTGGVLLGLTSMLAAPWLLVSGIRGRWLLFSMNEKIALIGGSAIMVVTLIDWAWRLFSG